MSQLSLFESDWKESPFLVVDTETTGLNPKQNRIIELAWVLFDKSREIHGEARLCSIPETLPPEITRLTGIEHHMLEGQPPFQEHIPDFLEACSKAAFLVAYNAPFDRAFIECEFERAEKTLPPFSWVDPCVYIKEFDRYQKGKKLGEAAARWGVRLDGAHRALADAKAAGHLLLKMMHRLKPTSLPELLTLQNTWQKQQQEQYEAYKARQR